MIMIIIIIIIATLIIIIIIIIISSKDYIISYEILFPKMIGFFCNVLTTDKIEPRRLPR